MSDTNERIALLKGWHTVDVAEMGVMWLDPNRPNRFILSLPDYENDIDAAWRLIDEMQAVAPVTLQIGKDWTGVFCNGVDEGHRNPAKAICAAYLAVMEKNDG